MKNVLSVVCHVVISTLKVNINTFCAVSFYMYEALNSYAFHSLMKSSGRLSHQGGCKTETKNFVVNVSQ